MKNLPNIKNIHYPCFIGSEHLHCSEIYYLWLTLISNLQSENVLVFMFSYSSLIHPLSVIITFIPSLHLVYIPSHHVYIPCQCHPVYLHHLFIPYHCVCLPPYLRIYTPSLPRLHSCQLIYIPVNITYHSVYIH